MEIGSKIRRLRKLRGLTIEELATGADLTKGFISQLERDMTLPNVLNLKQIVEFLGIDLAKFFSDFETDEHSIYTKKDRFEKRKSEQFQIFDLVPRLKYLEMEAQLIVIAPGKSYNQSFEDDEGFGYILKGSIEVAINEEKRNLTRGGCFYVFFDNKINIRNFTDKPAELLIVNY